MKHPFLSILTIAFIALACNTSRNLTKIEPKEGNIEIPANGEFRIWKDILHSSFEVELSNNTANQTVEVYYVKKNGTEKWTRPSLQAQKKSNH